MFSAKELTPEQVDGLNQLASEGAKLSDLQRYLKDNENIAVTYMDIRMLVLDLGIQLIEEEKKAEPKPEEIEEAIEAKETTAAKDSPEAVSVSMDSVAVPGAMVSGKATFSDGETAVWMIDQTGRPGLDPDTPGYRPSEKDVMAFQAQLRALLEKEQGQL